MINKIEISSIKLKPLKINVHSLYKQRHSAQYIFCIVYAYTSDQIEFDRITRNDGTYVASGQIFFIPVYGSILYMYKYIDISIHYYVSWLPFTSRIF